MLDYRKVNGLNYKIMMKRFFTICILLLEVCIVYGQDGNNTKYFLENMPGRFRLNPAYQPEYKTYIGLPVLSGISVNYLNTGFDVESALRKGKFDSVYVDVERFHKGLRRYNRIALNNENDLFTFGLRLKNGWYFTFDVAEKNDVVFSFDRDIFTFLLEGNANYLGKTFDFGGLGLNSNVYGEVAVGLSKKMNDKLTVGARVKYLKGFANVSMTDSDMGITTSSDGEHIKLNVKQRIRVSAPLKYTLSPDGFVEYDDFDLDTDDLLSSLGNSQNHGFAVDLGAEYQFLPKLKLYASLLDLGFIHWGSNTHTFKQNTSYDWKGVDFSNSVNSEAPGYKELDDAFDDLINSMTDSFRFVNNGGSYTTMLHTKLYAGATYELHKMLNVGGLFKATMLGKAFYPSLTFSANARLLRNVSASVSYSTMFGNYANIGVGLTAKLGPLQLYVTTDNVLAANFTRTRSANFSFGINILTGHKNFVKRKKAPEPTILVVQSVPKSGADTTKKQSEPDTSAVVDIPVLVDSAQILREAMLEDVQPQVEAVAPVTTGEYWVIVGSFVKEKRALRLRKIFINKGFVDTDILLNDRGMFQVGIFHSADRESATDMVNSVRESYPEYNDAWVLEKTAK